MPTVIGVDSSTQATKVQVRELDDGRLVASGRAPHPPTTPPRSEQDPAAWWAALRDALHDAGVADRTDVVGLAVAGQQHGLVLADEHGEPVRPAKLWNDTESHAESDALIERLGAGAWAAATGSVPVPAFTITKLAWMAAHEPDALARAASILLPHDWITLRLTGEAATDRGDASGTGYWSPAEQRWRPDLLALVDDRRSADDWLARLPRVLGPSEVAGRVQPEAATALGLPALAGATVAAGSGDNMAAALGVALRPGDTAISLGTSGTVFAVSDTPTADATGAVAGFADATGRFLPLVCTLNATLVTDTVARLLAVDAGELDALARSAPAGAGGVVLVPYLAGERTPNRPSATGSVHGLRTDASREQLARAAHEGVVCGLLEGLDALRAAGVPALAGPDDRLVLIGGGNRSLAYRRVVADLTGHPAVVPDDDELVATGAGAQAAAAVAGDAPDDVARRWALGTGRATAPDPAVDRAAIRARYAAARDRGQLSPP